MKRIALLWLVALCGCAVDGRLNGLVGGQGTDVGGAHEKFREFAPWFRGRNTVLRVCVVTDEPVRESWRERIAGAFAHWSGYFDAKQVDVAAKPSQQARRRADVRASCQGDEDIVFRISAVAPEVARAPGREVFGFAWQGADRAYVWLEPGASDTSLLHEWGHVFGVGHESGTIMAATPTGAPFDRHTEPESRWPIDGTRELFVRPDGMYVSSPIVDVPTRRHMEALFGRTLGDEAPRILVKRNSQGGWSDIGLDTGGEGVGEKRRLPSAPEKTRGLDGMHGTVGCRRYRIDSVAATFWEGLEAQRPGHTVSLELEGAGGESVVIPLRFLDDRRR